MKSPFTGKEMCIVKEWRTMRFRRDEFRVLFHSYKCEDTGEQFEDDLFAQLNYNQLVNQYREKYGIPFPEKIISIRKKYKLSAAKMSEILGFGANGYRQYEGGEVPNQSNSKLIQLAENPQEFKKLVDYSKSLDNKTVDKIYRTIDNLIEEERKYKFEHQLENYFFGTSIPNRLTGYKSPDLRKFAAMVVFFAVKLQPWKTKLNKLLFYADFLMYNKFGFSMSGIQYRAIPLGPVPHNFNSIFEYLCNKGDFEISYFPFPDGGTGEQFKQNSQKALNKELFSDDERDILNQVANRFKNTSTQEIIEITHKEKAWMENNEGRKMIDYSYSFDLSL